MIFHFMTKLSEHSNDMVRVDDMQFNMQDVYKTDIFSLVDFGGEVPLALVSILGALETTNVLKSGQS